MKLLDDTLSVSALVLIGSRVLVTHAEAHCPVKEDGDLARRGGQGLGLADARGQSPVERAQRGIGAADRRGDQSQARLTGGELLDVWPHAEFRRVRDAGHFFPASRPDDVMAECERFWRGDFARHPVVRSGEEQRRHFRSDRVLKSDGSWHFTTREGKCIGPFNTPDEAHDALARYISSFVAVAA